MKITASASTRIDLAGGTLDLHPLYLFIDDPLTVNASVNLRSSACVEPLQSSPPGAVRLISADLNCTVEAPCPDALELGGTLDLAARAVKFYVPQGGVQVTMRSSAPKGSGLGASSSLFMSLSQALCAYTGSECGVEEMIKFASAIEAQNLSIPTGLQDYYGAVLGGINGLEFGVKGTCIRRLHSSREFLEQLNASLIVSFTGISHFSGTSNWNMLKRFIDREGDTVERMEAINCTAHRMWDALLEEDLAKVAAALDEEWRNRRGLAEGVTTPGIDAMVGAAKAAGAWASKLCGAGGGGCMLTLAPAGCRSDVCRALEKAGARILEVSLDPDGLQLEREDD